MQVASRAVYAAQLAALVRDREIRFCEAYPIGLTALESIAGRDPLMTAAADALGRFRRQQGEYRDSLDVDGEVAFDRDADPASWPEAVARLAAAETRYRAHVRSLKEELCLAHGRLLDWASSRKDRETRDLIGALSDRLAAHDRHITRKHRTMRHRLALDRIERGEHAQAARVLEAWVTDDPTDTELYYMLGQALAVLERRDEASAIFDRGLKAHPNMGLFRSPGFRARQRLAADRGIPSIFLNTQFKSGSVYLRTMFENGLGIPHCFVSPWGVSETIVPGWLRAFAEGGAVCQHHRLANPDFLRSFAEAGLSRLVLHVRDPRQVMISAIHHFTASLRASDPKLRLFFELNLPRGYADWPLERKIDDFIERPCPPLPHGGIQSLEWEIRWIDDWLSLLREGTHGITVRITTFQRMRADMAGFIGDLLDFHGIDHGLFDWSVIRPAPEAGKLHFRRGELDEWKSVLTPRQRARVDAMMPSRVAELFG